MEAHFRASLDEKADFDKEVGAVTELCLDQAKLKAITSEDAQFLMKCKSMTKLTLNGVGITSLQNFPSIPSLKKLELTDNLLSGSLNFLTGCTNLEVLRLGGNPLKHVDDLKPLASLENLRRLDLSLTPVSKQSADIFTLLPRLQVLDDVDREGNTVLSESEVDDDEDDESFDEEEDEDDDEDEDEEGEDNEGVERVDLNQFYLNKFGEDDEEGDEGEYEPANPNHVSDEEISDDDDETESPAKASADGSVSTSVKRPASPSDLAAAGDDEQKKPRVE